LNCLRIGTRIRKCPIPLWTDLDIVDNQNGYAEIGLSNNSTGTGAGTIIREVNSAGSNFTMQLKGGNFTTSGVSRQDGAYIGTGGAGGLTLNTEAVQPIYFGIDNSEVMRITSAGNVGIGAAAPGKRFEVVGEIVTRGSGATGGVASEYDVDVTNIPSLWVNPSYDPSTPATGWTRVLTLSATSPGNVGIGTTTPQATLDVNGVARLALNSSAPATCSSSNEGTIALTHLATVCVCDTTPAWHILNSSMNCSW
jgi:hypothetical protein